MSAIEKCVESKLIMRKHTLQCFRRGTYHMCIFDMAFECDRTPFLSRLVLLPIRIIFFHNVFCFISFPCEFAIL